MAISTKLALAVVRTVHVLVIVYVIAFPYYRLTTSIPPDITRVDRLVRLLLNVLYVVTCSSILLHWRWNNDACVLTTIEAWLRGKEVHEGFIYSIIAPIYKFPKNDLRRAVRIGMLLNMSLVAFDIFKEIASTSTTDAIVFV